MEHKRSRSPHQLADSPSIERCPAYGHRHERLDHRIEMIDSTATADACPDSLGGEGRAHVRPFGIWLLELFWDLGFGIWSFPGPVHGRAGVRGSCRPQLYPRARWALQGLISDFEFASDFELRVSSLPPPLLF